MRQSLVAGNWKMNGSKASAETLLAGIKAGIGNIQQTEVAVCPPFPFLQMAGEALQGTVVALGAQNTCSESSGAYTGEVSAAMLKDFACKYVIVGHSERRQYYGEDDAVVARKALQVAENGMVPILCVGETLEERERGEMETVVARHVDGLLNVSGVDAFANVVVAYEPVWAIGTGITATPAQAQEVHAFIRNRIAQKSPSVAEGLRILYGGSMKPGNAAELMGQPDIDGGLIGGASLTADDFLAICKAGDVTL